MQYILKNDQLVLTVDSFGAEMVSILDQCNKEYLWQGDPEYWEGHAPNLFPYVGRTINGHYEYNETTYPMPLHGFACSQNFTLLNQQDESLTLRLQNNAQTEQWYPWRFAFDVTYRLQENAIHITYTVCNRDEKIMYFGLGGHPGFRLPMDEGAEFSDYRICFPAPCRPRRIAFDSNNFTLGAKDEYPLEDGYSIPLSYQLFDAGTIALTETPGVVVLENAETHKGVKLKYPQMDYLALWHAENTKACFLCVEPWCSLPSPAGHKTIFEEQSDLIRLEPVKVYANTWSIELL